VAVLGLALGGLSLVWQQPAEGAGDEDKPAGSPTESVVTNGYFAPGQWQVESAPHLILRDAKREKDLQVRITYPSGTGLCPVVVWSHGAYGSKDLYQPLARHWASHGYLVLQANHSDSFALGMRPGDPGAFRDWESRPKDVSFMLDSLEVIEQQVPALKGRLDRKRIGVGGHSYGAHTAQLIGGVTTRAPRSTDRVSHADPRVKAVIILSGQGTGEMLDTNSWKTLTRPALVVTGSKDDSGRTGKPYTWRLEPFEYAPPGDKYLLFIEGAHHGFGGIAGAVRTQGSGPPDPAQVRWVNAAAVAFWDAHLRDHAAARAFLASEQLAKHSQSAARLTLKPKERGK
jgi:predicted dienelactone hydrolase